MFLEGLGKTTKFVLSVHNINVVTEEISPVSLSGFQSQTFNYGPGHRGAVIQVPLCVSAGYTSGDFQLIFSTSEYL
jgi:hypothetical protein